MPLSIIRQDITKIRCDAIVNPTNETLSPDGGLDLYIHQTAGKELTDATKSIGHINIGDAVITDGFGLLCDYVIHTAGVVWTGGNKNEKEKLVSCYKNSLKLAKKHSCKSIAFPLISSGTYGYPKDMVLKIALDTISEFLLSSDMMVYLVVFDKTAFDLSEKLFYSIESYISDNYVDEKLSDIKRLRPSYPSKRRRESEKSLLCSAPYPNAFEEHSLCCDDSAPAIDIDDYIKLDESFTIKLLKLIDIKGMSDVECYKKANVSKQTWYKIMNDKHYKPNKKTAISFALALKLTLEETQNLLESVGFVLSNSSLFDVIIMYCLKNNIYDVLEIDSILFKYDQETLYSKL